MNLAREATQMQPPLLLQAVATAEDPADDGHAEHEQPERGREAPADADIGLAEEGSAEPSTRWTTGLNGITARQNSGSMSIE